MSFPARSLLLLFIALSSRTALPQTPPAPAAPTSAPVELRSLEDAVAQAVNHARVAAHLRPLTRIPARRSLRQIVCSSAFQDRHRPELLTRESEADSATVTLDPASMLTAAAPLPPDLRRVAEYDDRHTANGRRITRFSVAAFRSPSDPALAWVAVALYWSRFTEYFAIHLTHTFFPIDLAGPIPYGAIDPACTNLP